MKTYYILLIISLLSRKLNAQAQQIQMLQAIDSILSSEKHWEKQAQYNHCDTTKGTYTLPCAIDKAAVICHLNKKEKKEVSHTLRMAIYQYNHKLYLHPLTYFNRDKNTTFNAIKKVIQIAIERVKNPKA